MAVERRTASIFAYNDDGHGTEYAMPQRQRHAIRRRAIVIANSSARLGHKGAFESKEPGEPRGE